MTDNNNNIIIAKFGGTSVKTIEAMNLAFNILQKQNGKIIAVLSACGGYTNLIIDCLQKALQGAEDECLNLISEFENHHNNLIYSLIIDNNYRKIAIELANKSYKILRDNAKGTSILKELPKSIEDKCIAQGEILSSLIFYYFSLSNNINCSLLDIRNIITRIEFENSESEIKINIIELKKVLLQFEKCDLIITQGFICCDEYGNTTNLGRGGSDWTASILGSELNVKEIQIWTDVNGILTSDPKLLPNAKTIEIMNFDEVQALSFYGAKVLHPETIKQAINKNIPIYVLNTFNSKEKGTLISNISTKSEKLLKAVNFNPDCKLYFFELSNNSNKKNSQVISLYNKLISLKIPIYLFELRDNQLIILLKKDIQLENYFDIDTFEAKFKAVDVELVACIGLQNQVLIDDYKILSFFKTKDCLIFNYNIETKILISIFLPEKGKDFYNFIHKLIIE